MIKSKCTVSAILVLAAVLVAAGASAATAGTDVTVKCVVSSQDLFEGTFIKIGRRRGAVLIALRNGGTQKLQVGSDLHLLIGKKVVYLVNTPGLTEDDRHALLYAAYADYFTALDKGKLVNIGFSAWGQQFRLQESVSKDYKGKWPGAVPAKGSAAIQQQLTTWPGGASGWVATPVLKRGPALPGFRIIGKFATDGSVSQTAHVPMQAKQVLALVRDSAKPMGVREWAVGWLTDVAGGAEHLVALVQAQGMPTEVRIAAVRWLAVRLPEKGLPAIDKLLWARGTPKKLQAACYYSFAWALTPVATKAHHAMAWRFIRQAAKHPNAKISAAARKKLASKK